MLAAAPRGLRSARLLRHAWLLCALLATGDLQADEPVQLPPLLIEVTREASTWLQTPAAVSAQAAAARPGEPGQGLDESLQPVPGLFTLNRHNLAQGLRLSLRGFGARAGFGIRGLRVVQDGIPLTLPDGQTELDALDVALVERVEVLRGPAAALYGNAAGGVLLLHTREPAPGLEYRADVIAGEPGSRQLRAEVSGGDEALPGLLAVARREQDGFRRHAAADSRIATGKLDWMNGEGRLRLSVNALDIESQDPGALTADEARADRRAAAPSNLRFDAGEVIRQQRIGLNWQSALDAATDYQLRAWGGQREFANRLPFMGGGQTAFERDFGGAGLQLARRADGQNLRRRWVLGLDVEAQADARRRYDNLDGARGAETLRQDESVRAAGLYFDHRIEAGGRWLLEAGLRQDWLRFEADDRFLADGDDSGNRRLDQTSLRLALGYRPTPRQLLYVRAGNAFETPTIAEFANPAGGGFNDELEPAQAASLELGFKDERDTLRYEFTLFTTRVRDELVRFELPAQPGRSFFRNAARSRRDGLELAADWALSPHWQLTAAYALGDYRFERYATGGMDWSGNTIPGIPRQQLFAELRFLGPEGRYARLNLTAVDRLFADDANGTRVPGYALANLRVGLAPAQGRRWAPYLGINNIFRREYHDNIRINAGGGRYFEPAPGRTAYAGISARW
jgi:iron complex outermembrane recepter protein